MQSISRARLKDDRIATINYPHTPNYGQSYYVPRRLKPIEHNRMFYAYEHGVATEDNSWKLNVIRQNHDKFLFNVDNKALDRFVGDMGVTNMKEEEMKERDRIKYFFKYAEKYHAKVKQFKLDSEIGKRKAELHEELISRKLH